MTLHSPTRSRRSPLCCAPEAGGGAEQSLPLPAWEEKVPDPLRGGFQDGGAAEVLRAGLREPMRSGRLGGLQTRRRPLGRGSWVPEAAVRRIIMAPACERLQFRFPGYGDGVLHRMDQLREQRRFCDVTVQVNELRVPGHRVVFAACSPFLRDQFLLNDSQEVTVSLFQSPEIGRQLLLSCYTGCLDVPIKELVNYLTAASFLQMGHVVERCAQAVSHYLVPKADALLQENQEEESSEHQDGEEEEEEEEEEREKQPSSSPGKAGCEENKMAAVEFTPRSSHGPASPAISLSLLNSAVEITRSYLQGCYDDEMGSKGLPFPSTTSSPASPWRNYPLHRHRHGPAINYREWRTGSGVAAWKVPGLERPYRCPRCSRVFQQLGHLVSHVQEHKLFLCLRCGKVFSQKSNLTRHIRVHTGFKPFQCPICHKCFTQNATLQDHLNLHSGIKPHRCNYCEMHFTHKPGLRRHLKELHGKSTVQNSHEEIEEVTIDFDVRAGREGSYTLNSRFFCEPKGARPAPTSSL